MLTQEIKKKIDSARGILVGKVPDPKAQVEQITTALIYKFMDDMDKRAAALPKGKPKFFSNGFGGYSWTKVIDTKLGGQERLNLYVDAITKMSNNPHLPQLFRDVFKGAYLPYRDPETLNLFLKEINGFEYDHSENLGDAFEYLLSVLGSQGDAGQFRTPRHIIDFIVEVIDPKKEESVLDPACGTAGFLISAYKHILKSNKNRPLNPDEKKRLMSSLVGYDISPDMVKLSLVNMYLHGFPSPNIYEYDSLTSDERWDERFDVMLANPPFMTPKGGVRPHKRFMVQANRTEVLFVDYILEHLNSNGRAGIIVPEGIIFQTSNAYAQLRKLLIEKGLYAVVSLPVGTFNPYTKTTKTSILFIDPVVQKKNGGVAFLKVENDGYDLGAERKSIEKNDLPLVLNILNSIKKGSIPRQKTEVHFEIVKLSRLEKREDFNLSILHDVDEVEHKLYQNIEIGKILEQKKKTTQVLDSENYKQITVKMNGKGVILRKINSGRNIKTKRQSFAETGDFIMSKIDARNGAFGIVPPELNGGLVTQDFPLFRVNESVMLPEFLNIMMQSPKFIEICQKTSVGTSNRKRVKIDRFLKSRIPVRDLATQRKIINNLSKLRESIEKREMEITTSRTEMSKQIAHVWGE